MSDDMKFKIFGNGTYSSFTQFGETEDENFFHEAQVFPTGGKSYLKVQIVSLLPRGVMSLPEEEAKKVSWRVVGGKVLSARGGDVAEFPVGRDMPFTLTTELIISPSEEGYFEIGEGESARRVEWFDVETKPGLLSHLMTDTEFKVRDFGGGMAHFHEGEVTELFAEGQESEWDETMGSIRARLTATNRVEEILISSGAYERGDLVSFWDKLYEGESVDIPVCEETEELESLLDELGF